MNCSLRTFGGLFAAAFLSIASASGSVIETITANQLNSTQAGSVTIDFDSAIPTGITFSSLPLVTGSISDQYAEPANDNTKYLTVGSPSLAGSVTITSSFALSYYGFYLGSPDSYNTVSFYKNVGDVTPIATFSGFTPANGDLTVGEYVDFNTTNGDTFSQIVLSSSSAAMETDNHAFVNATPEPATLGLMGASLMAFALYRRKRA